MRRFYALLLISISTVLLDRWTKTLVIRHLAVGESIRLTSFFAFTYVQNTGTAFGLFQNNNGALMVVAVLILAILFYSSRGLTEQAGLWGLWAIGLIIGGAVGNIIDRLLYGRVIDFIDFHFYRWVFNIADSAISLGAACLAIGLWKEGHR